MARTTTRRKNFGMAKAVKKSPTQKRKNSQNGKPSPTPRKTQQAKKKTNPLNHPRTTSTTTTATAGIKKRDKEPDSVQKVRSTQSIQKREIANASEASRRSTKNGCVGGHAEPMPRPQSEKKCNTPAKIVSNANAKKSSKTSNTARPSGGKSPSVFDQSSLTVYQALNYAQKCVSTAVSLESLEIASRMNDVVVNSNDQHNRLCERSPDLFETELSDGHQCGDSTNISQNEDVNKANSDRNECDGIIIPETDSIEQVEMVSTGGQTDAQAKNRIRMIDAFSQTSPSPCTKCGRFEMLAPDCSGRHDIDCDNGLNSFNEFIEPKDDDDNDCGGNSYISDDSSYDHCLDDFDCLEHLDDVDPDQNLNNYVVNEYDGAITDDHSSVIDGSPPRHLIYKNNQFHSPESLEANKAKSLKY